MLVFIVLVGRGENFVKIFVKKEKWFSLKFYLRDKIIW